jgi:hypothetical protein
MISLGFQKQNPLAQRNSQLLQAITPFFPGSVQLSGSKLPFTANEKNKMPQL